MQDKAPGADSFSILIMMLVALVAATGFSSAANVISSKDEAIASLKQQLAEAQRGIDTCQAEFSGYEKGRH